MQVDFDGVADVAGGSTLPSFTWGGRGVGHAGLSTPVLNADSPDLSPLTQPVNVATGPNANDATHSSSHRTIIPRYPVASSVEATSTYSGKFAPHLSHKESFAEETKAHFRLQSDSGSAPNRAGPHYDFRRRRILKTEEAAK